MTKITECEVYDFVSRERYESTEDIGRKIRKDIRWSESRPTDSCVRYHLNNLEKKGLVMCRDAGRGWYHRYEWQDCLPF